MMRHVVLVGALVAGIGAALRTSAQTPAPATPPLVVRSIAGQDLFAFYCATCHGRDARGNGPVAAVLKIPPPDLTTLARRRDGTFPRQQVEMFVTSGGPALPAHGSSDMPVWGPVFRGLDSSDTLATVRIANIVDYLSSIQAK